MLNHQNTRLENQPVPTPIEQTHFERKNRDYGGKKRQPSRSQNTSNQENSLCEWYTALQSALETDSPSALAIVNNGGASGKERNFIDQQLAEIASITSAITKDTRLGKEPRVVYDIVGFPPYTFSTVQEFRQGSSMILANSWQSEGMRTLLHHSIKVPASDADRRTAILYGVGPINQLNVLENVFLECFDPAYSCSSFGPETNDNVVRFFVQWGLTEPELADALGIEQDAPEMSQLQDLLENQSKRMTQIKKPISINFSTELI